MSQTIQLITRKAHRVIIRDEQVPINDFRVIQILEAFKPNDAKTVHFIRQEWEISKKGHRSLSAEYYLTFKRTIKYIQINGHYLSHQEFKEYIEALAEKEFFMHEIDIVKELMWRFK